MPKFKVGDHVIVTENSQGQWIDDGKPRSITVTKGTVASVRSSWMCDCCQKEHCIIEFKDGNIEKIVSIDKANLTYAI